MFIARSNTFDDGFHATGGASVAGPMEYLLMNLWSVQLIDSDAWGLRG